MCRSVRGFGGGKVGGFQFSELENREFANLLKTNYRVNRSTRKIQRSFLFEGGANKLSVRILEGKPP